MTILWTANEHDFRAAEDFGLPSTEVVERYQTTCRRLRETREHLAELERERLGLYQHVAPMLARGVEV